MLIGCSAQSSLFQGFPGKHLPCRNVSGMGCEEYYGCQAWSLAGRGQMGSMFGSGPPECCAVAFEAIKAINLSKLGCEGYSSAYSLAPACEATGGTCGYGSDGIRQLCMCGNMNSTSNCDSATSATSRRRGHGLVTLTAIFFCILAWI
ncbi:hypothetical protein OIU77_007671 [Salix suchowensis]|uniref:Uncharacterized protein n=1 Tax=Salix suchowensis TaxID=1278906 RepID=A0ABQ9AHR8_9ROSI|nr:hypothetical protein OIU77_007671 [Salix suchowensis]